MAHLQLNNETSSKGFEVKNSGSTPVIPLPPEKKKLLRPRDYLSWMENPNNGMIVSHRISDMSFSVFYKPLDYVALKELDKTDVDLPELTKKREELEGLQYFTLRIASEESKDLLRAHETSSEDYNLRIQYFSFHMQNDIRLVDGRDTIPCVLNHFERTYGLAPYRDFVLAFDQSENSGQQNEISDKTIIYEDRIFGKGTVKLKVKAQDIKHIPQIITSKI